MDTAQKTRTPIPAQGPDGAQREVPVADDGDALVAVLPGAGLHVDPIYHRRGLPHAPEVVHLRAGVVAALVRVSAALPAGVDLLIWDGLRTLDTQGAMVDAFRHELPDTDDREEIVDRYLAAPPASEQAFRAAPPPHATGGAVDLTLCDLAGRPLDLGAEHDQFDELSWLCAFESAADADGTGAAVDPEDVRRGRRRRTLYWSMLAEGFSPYLSEFWHYELGTGVEATFHDRPLARYGAAVPWTVPAGRV